MSARLLPLKPGAAPTILLQRPVLLVGRHPECDVRIDLPKVSRRHCCLALAYERVVIKDLGSRNGLRVNGEVVEEARLIHGDEVAIGPLVFRVEDPETAPPPPALPAPAAKAAIPPPTLPGASRKRPPSLPSLPANPNDPDDELIPIDF
jgi:predicted component of type VI protein secretion system